MAGHRQVRADLHPPCTVGLRPRRLGERLGEADGLDSRGPHDGPRVDPLLGAVDLDRHAVRVDRGDARALAHRHTELGEVPRDLRGELLAEGRGHALAGVEQDYPRLRRLDAREVALHSVVGDDRQLARELDSRRAAADHDERQPLLALGKVLGALGLLVCGVDLITQLDRVAQRLQAEGDIAPLVFTEVGSLRPAGHDQAVVVERLTAVQHDLATLGV